MYWIHEYCLSPWSTIISFLTSLHNIEGKCFNMHLGIVFWNASIESTCHSFAKLSYKYMKVQRQLELLSFQVYEDLVRMDMISTFHYLVIIYQSFNGKISWKFWKTKKFRTYFSSIFLIYKFLKLYVQFIINSMKCSMISKCNLNSFKIYLTLMLKRDFF
jgi:hypothetical protein